MTEKERAKPMLDRIIVKANPVEDKTEGGLELPDISKEKPVKGVVLKVGPGKADEPMLLQEGKTIIYTKGSGTEVELDGEKYLVMRQGDVMLSL